MDIITQDLLENNHITQVQVDRLTSRGVSNIQLLETLVKVGTISSNFLKRFIVEQIQVGKYGLNIIQEYPFLDEQTILEHLADSLHISFIDLDNIEFDYSLAEKIPLVQLQRYKAIPIAEDDYHITIVFANPLDITAQESIQRLFSKPIQVAISQEKQLESYLNKMLLKDSVKELVASVKQELNSTNLETSQDSSSILKLINVIINNCIQARSSDIHIEPRNKNCIVRGRIDGKLSEMFIFDNEIYAPLSSRLKLLANLDIAEKRKPQDGRFSMLVEGKKNIEYDFRISTLPTIYGESIVMRVLDKSKALVKLEDAGMDSGSYKKFSTSLTSPFGLILVTGPTGSGKTTTLYGALNEIKSVEDKTITVEDPVEYRMNGIEQVQVNSKVGLSFADALRSILRQDPDKIMIGEIRDFETLEIAIKAALTGHLVISTLHTNDAISAITRMSDMGIPPYLISGAVVAIQAQRLVRKICPACKVEDKLPIHTRERYKEYLPEHIKIYKGEGCKECNHSGYSGREMICEVLPVDEKIASLIAKEASYETIEEEAVKDGFQNMFLNGIEKVKLGTTTLEEILRVAKL